MHIISVPVYKYQLAADQDQLTSQSVGVHSSKVDSMGKRKKSSRKPQGPKKKEPLPIAFPCLFCNHEKSVSVKMDKKAGTGELSCKVCGQSFQTGINYLSAAVDVYSDWIDACDTVAKEAAESDKIDAPSAYADLAAGAGGRRNSDMQIFDRHLVDVVDDDGEADYADN